MMKKSKILFNKGLFSFSDFKKRVIFVIFFIFLFRIGSFIPIPGINTEILDNLFSNTHGSILEIFNMFSGGSLSRASIFALGIMPYISASMIIQFLTFIISWLKELKQDGEFGKQKINQYTRYLTIFLSIFHSLILLISLPKISGMKNIILYPSFSFYFVAIISLVTGTMFLMWLGELITEKGLGNGISLIIFSGIVSSLPRVAIETIYRLCKHEINLIHFFIILLTIFLIVFFVIFIEKSQRNIAIFYSRKNYGNNFYNSLNSSYLPLKLNMAGVMPAIFASSIVLLLSIFTSWLSQFFVSNSFFFNFLLAFSPNGIFYFFLYVFSIVFFCFFYTELAFNPDETANNLKKSGAYLKGIRPGFYTAQFIRNVIFKLTCIGSIYIVFICLLPEIMRHGLRVSFYFGGTSLLIVVLVIIEFLTHVQTLIISTQYKSSLKKANFYLKN